MIPSVVARQVRETLLDYLRTTFALADAEFERALFDFLNGDEGLFKGPYVDIRIPFRKADAGERIPLDIRPDFEPYKHQLKAFQRLYSKDGHQPQHTLVTTGTGSGKTECFLYPVLDHCWRNREKPGVKAILLYPMNALASDQARRLAQTLWEDEELRGRVSAGLYVGGKGQHGASDREHLVDKREVLRDSPPDILLTNYKMLDFLLLRPEDRRLWRHNIFDTLRYLVLDELHTYDGAQGSDVACLVRRLKSRLGCAPGSVCSVGTSATIGGRVRGETLRALTAFASKVFEEDFFEDSVIIEDRYEAAEALGDTVDLESLPPVERMPELVPEAFSTPEDWVRRQAELWLGEDAGALAPTEIGERLGRHSFLREVLRALATGMVAWESLDQRLTERTPGWAGYPVDSRWPLLQSFLGLVSHARRSAPSADDSARIEPFLTVHVQFWVRELRHLVRKVSTNIKFRWDDSTGGEIDGHWLPVAHCRDCGAAGLAATQREGQAILQDARPEIGRAWLNRHRSARFIAFGHDRSEPSPEYLCPGCLSVSPAALCACRPGEPTASLPVRIADDLSEKPPIRFLARCSDCGSDQSLGIMGSRAASLLSVAVSHLFQSPYNRDKKLLAFTDSVQDASHRSGFFGARTYRFNLRTAFQGVLEATDGDVPMADFADRVLGFWGQTIERPKLVATLMPADLKELTSYVRFLEKGGAGSHRRLDADLGQRLSWEVALEYGHNALVGRTLERTLCSTVAIDPIRLTTAVELLGLELSERTFLDSAPGSLGPETLRHFLRGFLRRMRTRGGIYHPLLKAYIENEGNWFLLTKQKQRLMSPFGRDSRLPRFVADRSPAGNRAAVFEIFPSTTTSLTWLRDWAERALGVERKDPGINDLYREALHRLEGAGLLVRTECGRTGSAWGLNPEALAVTRHVALMRCLECRREVTLPAAEVDEWVSRRCPQYRCEGMLGSVPEPARSYYSSVYRSGRLERIFSEEHTGLLSRAARERLEERFKSARDPDAPNLLVATPTLEMGIDIGDLSAAVMCSVPPTTANYLQRVGRAGRATGNSLCLTLANSRPHDLYFQAEPMEMLSGEVLPPGCFLDAPEMLKRQLVAFGMDAWARRDEQARAIPPKTTFVLSEAGWKEFPGRFLAFYRENALDLTSEFLGRFRDELSDRNRQRLLEFGEGEAVPAAVEKAFQEVRLELDDLRGRQRRCRERLQEIEGKPDAVDDPAAEKAELEESRRLFSRLIIEIGQKYPLNVLTDAGVLPNYAFPEPGVTLKSVVREDSDGGGEGGAPRPRYQAYEYVRPASSAIRELAPFNTFYAEGRRVQIGEVDVGNKARPLTELWRLCAECAHMVRSTAEEEASPECSRCGDTNWPDAGQLRTLVHFRRARSLATRLEATTVDDRDDREESFYQLADLIDVGRENMNGARLIPELPFGYELLRDLSLREVNFGSSDASRGASKLRVAGVEVNDDGFEICRSCGRVRKGANALDHAPYCRGRRANATADTVSVYLYRQIESEAIRVLLPAAELDLDRRRSSFRAALELGFRRRFQGNPGHLPIKSVREPIMGGREGHRQFLVIFDAVPGGTGYLSELWQGDNFLQVLEMAYRALQACRCQVEGRDGCYRCIFAYQEQRYLPEISSSEAQRILKEILDRKGELASVDTLSEVSLATRLESELEEKFLRALADQVPRIEGAQWEESIRGGEKVWILRFGETVWELRCQQDVGASQGVAVASRPDFLLRPLRGDSALPVAIFCDGFAYHVCPEKERARIEDDIRKRSAIIESGRYLVWSVTWKDVTDLEAGRSFVGMLSDMQRGAFGRLASDRKLEHGPQIVETGSGQMLLDYLQKPATETWRDLARVAALAWLAGRPTLAAAAGDALENRLHEEPRRFVPGPMPIGTKDDAVLSRLHQGNFFYALARCSTSALRDGRIEDLRLVLRLFDEQETRREQDFEADWRVFLHAWNLLQFHPNIQVMSSEMLDVSYRPPAEQAASLQTAIAEPAVAPSADLALAACLELASIDGRPLIEAVRRTGGPLPESGYELTDDRGEVIAEADLGWPDKKVAVLADDRDPDRRAFENRDWTVLVYPLEPGILLGCLGLPGQTSA